MVSWVVMVVVVSCAAARGAAATMREAIAAVNFILTVERSMLLSRKKFGRNGAQVLTMKRKKSDRIRLDRALRL